MDKRYIVTKPALSAHYNVASEDGADAYYVDIKTKIMPSKPRLTFHTGGSTDGSVAAVLHFQVPTVDMKVGLGDPADLVTIEWEDLSCMNKLTHAKYTWSVNLPSSKGMEERVGDSVARRTFIWTRTRNQGIDGKKPSGATNRHWKLAAEGSEELLAIFTGDSKLGKCGTLAMREDLGGKFHLMALVTLLGMYDRARTAGGG